MNTTQFIHELLATVGFVNSLYLIAILTCFGRFRYHSKNQDKKWYYILNPGQEAIEALIHGVLISIVYGIVYFALYVIF
jgi:hypothetical protein